MRSRITPFLIMLLTVAALRASELEEARAALADHLPAVAEVKARAVLHADGDSEEARRLLARALALKGETAAALAELSLVKELTSLDQLWQADLQKEAGQLDQALAGYRALQMEDDLSARRMAVLGEAEVSLLKGEPEPATAALRRWLKSTPDVEASLMLVRLLIETGRVEEAKVELGRISPMRPIDVAWQKYLVGRVALLEGREEQARTAFRAALATERALTMELAEAASLGIAHAFLAQRRPEEATEALESFIRSLNDASPLGSVFALLNQAYAAASDEIPRQLEQWAGQNPSPRMVLALFYLAQAEQRSGQWQRAEDHLNDFLVHSAPEHPLRLEAHFRSAQIHARQEEWETAMRRIEEALATQPAEPMASRLQMLGGWVLFQQGAFDAAGEYFFAAAAAGAEARGQEQALFNTALARLNAHDRTGFLEAYRAFSAAYPESPLRSDLIFGQGMLAARAGEEDAARTLRRFTADFSNNQNVTRAQLALAEIAWLGGAPAEGAEYLQVAMQSEDPEVQAKAKVLRIFENARSGEPLSQTAALRSGRDFLKEHPESALVPDVRMKMGEIYFRNGDYGNARTQFEILARDHTQSPYAEPALYLAGQAAARSMNPEQALELFEQVARSQSPLKLNARAEQARIKSQQGVDEEAVVLYEAVLNGQPDTELRFASMIGKGMSLVQLGEKAPARFPEALSTFDQVIAAADVTPSWRNEALYRKGKLLQALGRPDEALAAFYEALTRTLSAPAEAEVFWFYRAGSEAARILEQRGEFRGAVSVYDKLAAIEGPRAAEMKERKEQLQLEHFLWDEEPAAEPVR